MTNNFDPTKPVQTRDGRKARIICADAKSNLPIISLITRHDGIEYTGFHNLDGKIAFDDDTISDLINIPERITRWTIATISGGYGSKEVALMQCNSYKCAYPVELIFEDGKPVDVVLHKDEK